jgi:hypothetical protein
MSGCGGVLGLLHPNGIALAAQVLGDHCPVGLRPSAEIATPPWDLLILAPSEPQTTDASWLAGACRAADAIGADGLVYLLASPRARGRIATLLSGSGLSGDLAILHLPDTHTSATLLPLERRALLPATDRVVAPGVRRWLIRAAAGLPIWGMVARAHPSVGLVLRRPGARSLAAWALGPTGNTRSPIAAIRLRRNADRERAVVDLVPEEGTAMIAKVVVRGGSEARGVEAEALNLAGARASARAAGVDLPTAETRVLGPGCQVLLQDTLPGAPASWVLRDDPDAFPGLLARLADWLERWHVSTAVPQAVGRDRLERDVLEPAARLATRIAGGAGYVRWLEAGCRALEEATIPLVYVHGDLTMPNVLVRAGGPLAIVDWEAAHPAGWPLGDYVYAAVDAFAARDRYRDRGAAFDACFRPDQPTGRMVHQACLRLARAIDLSPQAAAIAFHSCWLHHADNESRKRRPGEARPFLTVLQRAANGRDTIAPWRERA